MNQSTFVGVAFDTGILTVKQDGLLSNLKELSH
jgi:hypothetical protein